jgi:HEAT repeat protein
MRVALVGALLALLASHTVAHAQADDVRAFVRMLHIEGIPLAEARRFDPDAALDPLLAVLSDPAEEPHWANAVVVLGMLGDERGLDAMLDKLEAGDGSVSEARWRAAKTVPMALGYLVHFAGSERALRYLEESLDPAVWQARGVRWRSPVHPDAGARDAHLTKMAILGLALTGDARAAAALRGVDPARAVGRPGSSADVERTRSLIDRVLVEHGRIAARGLACYYDPDRCG